MFEVRQALIDHPVARVKFACDLLACKGACCTLPGGKGAPLLDSELQQLEDALPIVRSYLSKEHLAAIAQNGLYEGKPGFYTTVCFNNSACVFVLYEAGIAHCAFEKAFSEGKLKWRKPLSCHLFPIRVDHGLIERLRYEHIMECEPASKRGEQEQIFLSDFLREALLRAYGQEWYQDFLSACNNERNKNNDE